MPNILILDGSYTNVSEKTILYSSCIVYINICFWLEVGFSMDPYSWHCDGLRRIVVGHQFNQNENDMCLFQSNNYYFEICFEIGCLVSAYEALSLFFGKKRRKNCCSWLSCHFARCLNDNYWPSRHWIFDPRKLILNYSHFCIDFSN